MLEYYVIEAIDGNVDSLQRRLNHLAKEGWHFTGSVMSMVILEREISPRIEETKTETERILTYAFPL